MHSWLRCVYLWSFLEYQPTFRGFNEHIFALSNLYMSCLMQGVLQMEKKLGGCLMDKPKTMLFQDGGASLCLSMEDIGPGWKSKPQADYQVHIPNRYNWVTVLIIIHLYHVSTVLNQIYIAFFYHVSFMLIMHTCQNFMFCWPCILV